MKNNKNNKWMIAALLVLISSVIAVTYMGLTQAPVIIEAQAQDVQVTVYNSDLGVVKEYRNNYMDSGVNRVLYEGVASMIDPTSVRLRSMNGNLEILEQNYQYDLVSKYKILQKYVGENITGYQIYGDKKELVEGTLLSYDGSQVVLRDREGKLRIISVADFVLPDLPEGLITKPTLEWLVESGDSPKNHTLELSYMTSGMSWKADYVAIVDKDDRKLDWNGWVTVTNNAGTTFKDATLKLVAGDVNRVVSAYPVAYDAYEEKALAAGSTRQFAEESFFEYHIYDLQRKTTLRDKEQKQISLMESGDVSVTKEYVYNDIQSYWWYGNRWTDESEKKVDVVFKFDNSQANSMGMPLPAGTVRLFKEDSEGLLQFIGEDAIDHTPKDETVELSLGKAFDVVGERKQMDMNILSNWYEYEWQVTLRNHKTEDIVVTVVESTSGDWDIVKENFEHTKESNSKITWKVPVKADGEVVLSYTIRYKKW